MVGRAGGHRDTRHGRDPVADRARDRRHRRPTTRAASRLLCAALILAGLVRLVFSVARRIVSGNVSLAVEYDLRNGLYAHLQALELGFFDRQQTGQLMSRATVDLQSIRFFLGYGFVWIAQSALTILFAAVAMFALDPGLAAMSLVPVPFVVVVAFRYGRRSRPAHPGGPAADRRADRGGGGERLRRARGQGVRGRAAPARALPPPGGARVRPGDVLDPAERVLPAVHRLPAEARPRRDPARRRARA